MRTPEEVALEVQRELARHEFDPDVIEGLAMGPGCTCGMRFSDTDTHDRAILADLIRERDAEVRADALAELHEVRAFATACTGEDGFAGVGRYVAFGVLDRLPKAETPMRGHGECCEGGE